MRLCNKEDLYSICKLSTMIDLIYMAYFAIILQQGFKFQL